MATIKFKWGRHLLSWKSRKYSRRFCHLAATQLSRGNLDDDVREILVEALLAGAEGKSIDQAIGIKKMNSRRGRPVIDSFDEMLVFGAVQAAVGDGHGLHKERGGAYFEVAGVLNKSPGAIEKAFTKYREKLQNQGIEFVAVKYPGWRSRYKF